ncbi:MAG: hypothetical protein OEZ43_06305 [Gammaproteobacteria bacterium]|nr:hypothetical protein [Gammaproteobacteria bacterium]
MMKHMYLLMLFVLIMPSIANANEVEIMDVLLTQKQNTWTVRVTLKHEDSGWDHYADAWRVVDKKGNELGRRVLMHPHETEQPFTRSLGDLKIPRNIKIIYIEARDNVHGWADERVQVDLDRQNGPRYRVNR